MIHKFTQFKSGNSSDSKSSVFKPFEFTQGENRVIESRDDSNKTKEVQPPSGKLKESFIPINIPPFDRIIKDLESKVNTMHSNDPDEYNGEEEENQFSEDNGDQEEIPYEAPKEILGYRIYRDKNETFECRVSVEGSSINDSSARLVLDSDEWNLIFYGRIDQSGRCVIPMKKVKILSENLTGEIRLEIIVDDTIFVPWKERFVVVPSKKVSVEILSNQRNYPEKSSIKVTEIKGH